MTIRLFLTCTFLICIGACTSDKTKLRFATSPQLKTVLPTLFIQPLGNCPSEYVDSTFQALKKFYPSIEILAPETLPQMAFVKTRNRYRADSLLSFLAQRNPSNGFTLGLTTVDISATKGKHNDWGVMGLGQCPGTVCIASSFRLTKKNKIHQLFKVAIHELGHTQGLPHCPISYCFMRDAEGGNPTDEEKKFCESCGKVLLEKGWFILN